MPRTSATSGMVTGSPTSPTSARLYRWLALLPTLGMLGGVPLANREQPYVLGMPPLLAWIVGWVLVVPLFLYAAYRLRQRA